MSSKKSSLTRFVDGLTNSKASRSLQYSTPVELLKAELMNFINDPVTFAKDQLPQELPSVSYLKVSMGKLKEGYHVRFHRVEYMDYYMSICQLCIAIAVILSGKEFIEIYNRYTSIEELFTDFRDFEAFCEAILAIIE